MQNLSLFMSIFLFTLGVSATSAANELKFTGNAYDLNTKAPLYSEVYKIKLNEKGEYQSAEVTYRFANGELLAKKHVDYQTNPLAPSINFTDFRDNLKINVKSKVNQALIQIQHPDEETTNLLRYDESQLKKPIVIDAGFDKLVHGHFIQLLDGDKIAFKFMAVERAKLISFKLIPTRVTEEYLDVRVQPSNWFVRMLLDPIMLRYQVSSKRLVRFEGLTNLRAPDTSGKLDNNFIAVIEYTY